MSKTVINDIAKEDANGDGNNHNDDVCPGEGDIVLDFSESVTVRKIFSKLGALQCLYTVQIIPRTDQDSVEVGYFPQLFILLAIIIIIMRA